MASLQHLLEPIAADNPCGEDRSYHPSLQQLNTLMQGTAETQVGTIIKPAEEPNWKELHDLAAAFLAQSKDLRATVILTLALLKLEGLSGFHDGLSLLGGLLDRYWDTIYPRLDPADNNDPTERVNILNNLSAPIGSFGDPYRFLERLQQIPLAASPKLGRVTMRDILASRAGTGTPAPAAAGAPPVIDAVQVTAILRDTDPAELKASHAAVTAALAAVASIGAFLDKTVGADRGANLDDLTRTLKEIQRSIAPFVPGALVEAAEATATTSATAARATSGYTGKIQSRDDVLLALEEVCKFYEQTEPSSPVPYLLRRAQRLVKMNFLEIMSDLTPDALGQLKVITGQTGEGKGPSEG